MLQTNHVVFNTAFLALPKAAKAVIRLNNSRSPGRVCQLVYLKANMTAACQLKHLFSYLLAEEEEVYKLLSANKADHFVPIMEIILLFTKSRKSMTQWKAPYDHAPSWFVACCHNDAMCVQGGCMLPDSRMRRRARRGLCTALPLTASWAPPRPGSTSWRQ